MSPNLNMLGREPSDRDVIAALSAEITRLRAWIAFFRYAGLEKDSAWTPGRGPDAWARAALRGAPAPSADGEIAGDEWLP